MRRERRRRRQSFRVPARRAAAVKSRRPARKSRHIRRREEGGTKVASRNGRRRGRDQRRKSFAPPAPAAFAHAKRRETVVANCGERENFAVIGQHRAFSKGVGDNMAERTRRLMRDQRLRPSAEKAKRGVCGKMAGESSRRARTSAAMGAAPGATRRRFRSPRSAPCLAPIRPKSRFPRAALRNFDFDAQTGAGLEAVKQTFVFRVALEPPPSRLSGA